MYIYIYIYAVDTHVYTYTHTHIYIHTYASGHAYMRAQTRILEHKAAFARKVVDAIDILVL